MLLFGTERDASDITVREKLEKLKQKTLSLQLKC